MSENERARFRRERIGFTFQSKQLGTLSDGAGERGVDAPVK